MPYVTAFFMPRQAGDRPDVVPEGAVDFASLGSSRNPRSATASSPPSIPSNGDRGCLLTARRRARRAGGIQLHLRHSYVPVRDRPPARRQGDRHPGPCVPGDLLMNSSTKRGSARCCAGSRYCRGRLTMYGPVGSSTRKRTELNIMKTPPFLRFSINQET